MSMFKRNKDVSEKMEEQLHLLKQKTLEESRLRHTAEAKLRTAEAKLVSSKITVTVLIVTTVVLGAALWLKK